MNLTKKKLLVLMGILIILSPFLGVPGLAKSIIVAILGLSVVGIALLNGGNKVCECDNCVPKAKPGSYVENANPLAVTETSKEEKEKLRI